MLMPSFVMIQWGIIGFFVVIHFLLGFARGSKKSTYFTVVSLIMTVVTLLIVANISFNWVFDNVLSIPNVLQMIQNYTGFQIPTEFQSYAEDPAIIGFAVAIADLVLRIIAYLVLYPIIKFFLTLAIFKPIWKHGFKKAFLKSQNAKAEIEYQENPDNNKKFVPSKKLKKSLLGRLFGGAMGAVRGFVVAFIFLLPIIVLASYVTSVSDAVNIENQTSQSLSADPNQQLITIPSEIQDILNNISDMNQNGLASITKDITIGGKPIDQYIFNRVFTTQVKDAGVKVAELNFGQELEGLVGIAGILIQGGYLDNNFDFKTISSANLDDIQQIFTFISQSDLLSYLIPFATEYGLQNALPDQYANPYDDPATAAALDEFTSIDWSVEFMNIYGIVEAILQFGSVEELMNYMQNPDSLASLSDDQAAAFGDIIAAIGQLQSLVLISAGIDYGLYTQFGDNVEAQLAEDIQTAVNDIDWSAEFVNVSDIYSEAFKLGLSNALGASADTMGFIDTAITEHMDSVRAIVTHVFEDSQIVNIALEIASPALVERFVTDEQLKDLVNEALMSDPTSGVVDFSFGQEINNLLTIVESVYDFTSASEIQSFSTMTLDEKVQLFSKFGSLTDTQFTALEDSFKNLQLLDRMGTTALEYAKTSSSIDQLYVPTTVDLGNDLASILGLTYYAAKYTYDNAGDYPSYEDIDFAPLLADETFRSYLMSTDLNNHSNLLFTNIAYNIDLFSQDANMSKYIAIPSTLADLSPESDTWKTEVNAFLGAILDLGASFEGSSAITLSLHDMQALMADTQAAPVSLFTQFADPAKATAAFGSLDSSQILRTSLVNIINTFGESTTSTLGFPMTTPAIAMDGEMLAQGMIVELINGLAVVAADAFDTMGVTMLGDIKNAGGTSAYLNAFSQLEDSSLDALGNITIIRGMLSDALLNPDMQAYLVTKINSAQSLFVADDNFFAVDPLLLDTEGAVKAEEISNLLISIRSLGITDSAQLSTLSLDTFTGLIGRNENLTTGEDDFDRLLGSGIIYTTLDKVFRLDAIGTFVSDTLSTSLGTDMSSFDITPPDAMLGNAVDNEPIEVGRIPKAEFRRMMDSISVIGDFSTVGLDTFSNLVDPLDPANDNFTTFIASDYIYVILGRMFENPGFGDYIGGMLSGAFGDDPITLTMSAPEDAKGTTGVEDGLMTRDELHNLMISFSMLDLTNDTVSPFTTLVNMIGANEDLSGNDDMDRFLASKYLDDKISQLLLAPQVIDTIGAGQFTSVDFSLPPVATVTVGTDERLTQQEIYNLFNGLSIMGISDFNNTGSIMDTVTSLSSTDIGNVLDSTYLYTVVDLMIKNQNTITLPATAFETSGDYDTMIKKSEVEDVFTAMDILGVTDLSTTPDPATITIGNITDVLNQTDSAIVQSLLSQAIINALDPSGTGVLPADAFEGDPANNLIAQTEIDALIDALNILSDNDPNATIDSVDMNTITVGDVDNLSSNTSVIIKQLISDAIADALGSANIPDEAYGLSSPSNGVVLLGGGYTQLAVPTTNNRLTDTELQAMIDALVILANGDPDVLVTDINTDVTVGQAVQLKGTDSFIIKQLVSDTVVDALSGTTTIPAEAYINGDTNTRLLDDEIDAMIDAMVILANGDLNLPAANIDTNINVGQVNALVLVPSIVMKQLVSEKITEQIDPLNEGKIPDEARIGGLSTNRLTDTEIVAMADALSILAGHDDNVLVTAISTDVTIGQVKELKGTASYIIKQLVSDAVVDTIGAAKVPDEAYINSNPLNRLTDTEIDAMIDALDILGDDAILVTNVSTDVTVGQAVQFKGTPSYIVKQLLSDAIIEAIDPLDEGKVPDEAHINSNPLNRLTDAEIDSMIDAIDILSSGDPNQLVTTISTDVNIGQVKELNNLTSTITTKLISDAIIDAITVAKVPNDAYILDTPGNNLKPAEVDAMIAALEILAQKTVDDNPLLYTQTDEVPVASVSTDVTIGQAQALDTSATGSSIIKFVISDSIITMITAPKIPANAYNTTYTDRLSDQEITDMLGVLDVLGASTDLVSSINTDINVGQLHSLHASPSLIIEKLINDSIIDAVGSANVPIDAYIGEDSNNYLTAAEVSAMIDAIDILADNNMSLPVSSISTDVTVGQAQALDTSATGSSIIKFIISDSIITMITAPKIPANAYNTTYTDRLSDQEITDMLAILDTLGASTDPVSTISTDITIGQLKDLQTSPSLIITKLISDSIITAVGLSNVPDDAYISDTPGNNLKSAEVSNMILALEVFAGSTVPGDRDTTVISTITTTNVTVAQTQSLSTNGSAIIKFIISDAVITMFGIGNIPADAYHMTYTDRLSDEEIVAIANALSVLGSPNDSVSTISTDVTAGQTQALDTTATGSVIIKQMISDNVVTMLGAGRIPDSAHIGSNPANRLTDSEIGYMQQSLLPLAGNDSNVLVSAITVTESTLSVATLKSFPDQSIILNRMISTAIITNLSNIPSESYVPLSSEDLLRSEIDYLLDALDLLGIGTDGAGSINGSAITFADLYTISAYGESDPLGYSPIIDHILSTPMISAVTDVRSGYDYGVPSTAYRNTYDLLHSEIVGLIDALVTIGGIVPANYATTTLSSVTIDTNTFNSTMLSSLIALDKLIVYRLISKGIHDASLDNPDAYALIGDTNYDPDLNNPLIVPTPVLYDIKIDEMNGIVDAMNIFGITSLSTFASSIDAAALASLTDAEVDTLLDNTNTIVYYLIDDIVHNTPILMAQLLPSDFEGGNPINHILRASLITLLKNNN